MHAQTIVRSPVCEIFLSEHSQNAPLRRGLGLAVRERRLRRGLSQAQLASAIGATRGRVSALERGELNPRYQFLRVLADALDVQLGVLLTRAEQLAAVEGDERR